MDLDAPDGRYRIDALIDELQTWGWLTSRQSSDGKHFSPRENLRFLVNFAGRTALHSAKQDSERPRHKKIAEIFFENLRDIQRSIGLACKVDPNDIADVTSIRGFVDEAEPWREFEDILNETSFLIKSLKNFNRQIESYLQLHEVIKLRGGNVDFLGNDFILSMAGICRGLMKNGPVHRLEESDVKLFSNLLEAAWTDLKFPLKDHRGKSLDPLDLFFEVRLKSMFKANRL